MSINLTDIDAVAKALSKEQVGIFPCDTIWGLIGLATPKCATKIRAIKNRPDKMPFILLIPNTSFLDKLTTNIPDGHAEILQSKWPGPNTFIFKKKESLDPELTGGKPTVALRIPDVNPISALLNKLNKPLISTSVNIHTQAAADQFSTIHQNILNTVDFTFNSATPYYQVASTIYDCSDQEIKLIRRS